MAKKGQNSRVFVVLFILLVVSCILQAGKVEGLTPEECKEERNILVNACKLVVIGRPASAYCCERVRVTHLECVCPAITPKVAALINIKYAIKVIQGCKRSVPRHYKCGSITTP